MNQQIKIYYKNKNLDLNVKRCNFFEKGIGLMFSSREKAKNLLFENKFLSKIPIHSFFVNYPFIALWLDGKNKVVYMKKVMPYTSYISSRIPCLKLVEVPLNKNNSKIKSFFRLD